MASIKENTSILDGVTMTAGAGDQTTSAVDLSVGYGGVLHVKLTNGATGPTLAAQVQIESKGQVTDWYEFGGALVGLLGNNGVISWSIDIPIGVEQLRLITGSNTGENVLVSADISEVTKL